MSDVLSSELVPSILIVDDSQENLQMMSVILKGRGYVVRPVASGKLALEVATQAPPDLILLDIDMPEMSGFEVCERLKANEALADIPVIFLSGLHEIEDKIRAFRVGGVDYITKPFHYKEIHARVDSQLKLWHLRSALERRNKELAVSNDRLGEAHRMHDSLLHMLVHDMRTPLAVQMGYTELLMSKASPPLGPDEKHWAEIVFENSLKLIGMVGSLLDTSRIEAGRMPINRMPNDLMKIAQDALDLHRPILGRRCFVLDPPDTEVMADCDESLIQRVIENLIGNAVKFTKDSGWICVSIIRTEQEARFTITDDGKGIAPEHHETIFAKFGQAGDEKRKHSSGIGLAFCKLAIEAQGGRIGVTSELGKGSTFWFTLPQEPKCLKVPKEPSILYAQNAGLPANETALF